MKTHKDLQVWQKSIAMVTEIYTLTKSYPKEEIYCIVNQIRRAAVSIPANIAEGCARRSTKEYVQFLYVSLGSAAELETHLIVSHNLEYITKNVSDTMQAKLEEIIRMLAGLIKSLSIRDNE
jgi:four helix bundle protein